VETCLQVYTFMAWVGATLLQLLYARTAETLCETAQLVAFVRGIDMACNVTPSN